MAQGLREGVMGATCDSEQGSGPLRRLRLKRHISLLLHATYYHRLCGLKRRVCSLTVSTGQESRHRGAGLCAGRAPGTEIKVLVRAGGLVWGWGPLPSSRVVGRMHFLEVVRLRSLFSLWLAAGGGPQLLQDTLRSRPRGYPDLRASNGERLTQQTPFVLQISDFLFQRKLSAFRFV